MKSFGNTAFIYTILLVSSAATLLAVEPAKPLSSNQSPYFASVSPWIASVRVRHMGITYKHECGASLIDRQWVLTAHHCLPKKRCKKGTPGTVQVWLGPNSDKDPIVLSAKEIRCHPLGNQNGQWRNDIALIRISEDAISSDRPLPVLASSAPSSEKAVAVGWVGSLAHTAELNRPTDEDCTAYLRSQWKCRFLSRSPEQLCAGSVNSDFEGLHEGDSGGPLLQLTGGRAELIGVASKACKVNGLATFENVAHHREWIIKTICKGEGEDCRERFDGR